MYLLFLLDKKKEVFILAKILKKRNWAFVVYPESAPSDWIEQLQQRGVVGAISPLHDKDLNATGEPKKAHWHVIVTYEGPTAQSVVERLTELLNAPKPIPLEQVRGYYRYLTHKDNPEKFQYDEKDIQTLNGFDIRDFVEMTKSEVNAKIRIIQALIQTLDILEYADLLDYLMDNDELADEYDVAISHTILLNTYIKSRRYKRERCQGSAKPTCKALDESEA